MEVRGSRDAFVCLCVRDETAALSDRVAFASSGKCAVLSASGLPAMSWKEEKTPAIGKGLLEWRGGVELLGKGGWYDIRIAGKDGKE